MNRRGDLGDWAFVIISLGFIAAVVLLLLTRAPAPPADAIGEVIDIHGIALQDAPDLVGAERSPWIRAGCDPARPIRVWPDLIVDGRPVAQCKFDGHVVNVVLPIYRRESR
jgi:hypothetical protein